MVNFDGVYIPPDVWNDKKLTLPQKLFLGLYRGSNNLKVCEEILGYAYSKSIVIKSKRKLIESGYIKLPKTPQEAKGYVLLYRDDGQLCEWCKRPCLILHEHHYPIPKAKGGTETVKICPNCHCSYHYILEEFSSE